MSKKNNLVETTASKIRSEKDFDLANIHSFLTSICMTDKENLSVFALQLLVLAEIMSRPSCKKYITALNTLLDAPKEKHLNYHQTL